MREGNTYYPTIITQRSFEILQDLRRRFRFLLIGGWAVFLYTHALKSKDIDIVVQYEELEKLRKTFALTKNERMKKYEVKREEVDIDIYVPFYSALGMPVEELQGFRVSREGFNVPKPEALLVLKLAAYHNRRASAKGQKDAIDAIAIVSLPEFQTDVFLGIIRRYALDNFRMLLIELVEDTNAVPELGLNQHAMARLKKTMIRALEA